MAEISGISGGGSTYTAGSGKIPVSNKEESSTKDTASTGENVDVEKLQAEYKQVCEMKAQLGDKKGPDGKEDSSIVMNLVESALTGSALGMTVANFLDIKELKGEFAKMKGKDMDPSSEPTLTKKELKALNWVKKNAFSKGLKSVDYRRKAEYTVQGVLGAACGFIGATGGGLLLFLAPPTLPLLVLATAAVATGATAPAVVGQLYNGFKSAKDEGKSTMDILQNNSEKESLPKVAERYGEYIKSEKDRKLFYGE